MFPARAENVLPHMSKTYFLHKFPMKCTCGVTISRLFCFTCNVQEACFLQKCREIFLQNVPSVQVWTVPSSLWTVLSWTCARNFLTHVQEKFRHTMNKSGFSCQVHAPSHTHTITHLTHTFTHTCTPPTHTHTSHTCTLTTHSKRTHTLQSDSPKAINFLKTDTPSMKMIFMLKDHPKATLQYSRC